MTLTLCGCATEFYFESSPQVLGPLAVADAPSAGDVRRLPMFTGNGTALGWRDLMDAVAWADVVIIGEQHDDAIGHAVQLAVVEDTVARWPQAVLSMEMLERDEQPLVDDYFDGIIDADQLARLTFSENWAGEGSWAAWYQPIIDAAKDGEGRVVAANAPRRYVKLARREGYARLGALPPDRRRWVAHPPTLPEGRYRKRFWEVMSPPEPPEGMPAEMPTEMPESMPPDKADAPDQPHPPAHPPAARHPMEDAEARDEMTPADREPAMPPRDEAAVDKQDAPEDEADDEADASDERRMPFHPLTDEDIEAIFRSQLVWDATMAQSIARANDRGAHKVIHLVGQFHCDFEGGTVLELRRRLPGARILVISMQRAWPEALLEEDRGRADIVIYTGERPPPEEDEKEEGTGDEAPAEPAEADAAAEDAPPHR
jgi:uncharacterized iron-regulated protein